MGADRPQRRLAVGPHGDRHDPTYGAGFDWKFRDVLQWTIEAFGKPARSQRASVNDRCRY
jgi:hypothetical protein